MGNHFPPPLPALNYNGDSLLDIKNILKKQSYVPSRTPIQTALENHLLGENGFQLHVWPHPKDVASITVGWGSCMHLNLLKAGAPGDLLVLSMLRIEPKGYSGFWFPVVSQAAG